MKKKIITLLTDFGLKDPFVGVMKGVIYNINPEATIVDLTHGISSQDIFEGAFTLFQACGFFPQGTIHIAVVDPGVGGERKNIIIETPGFTFVAPDNGIVSLALKKEKNINAFEITNQKYMLNEISHTFHGRDVFAPVGAYLSRGVKPSQIGKSIDEIKKIDIPDFVIEENSAAATIIHIDKFGNLITNIGEHLIKKIDHIHVNDIIITEVSASYEDMSPKKALAIMGSSGFLEISIKNDNASEIFGIRKWHNIIVDLKH